VSGETDRAFTIEPYAYAEARALVDGLGLSEPIAATLVRRGYRTPEQASRFLDAAESHDPFEFEAMREVVDGVLAAVESGRRVTVHGDYDVDGVCSTAILVGALRELGGECDWWIPDRLEDGYGLTTAGVERLAARGTELLLTADCGIGCADEVAAARRAGIEVIVTDHHTPGERLPECPILHPRLSGYPCPDLCATGVAYKLASALRSRAGREPSGNEVDPAASDRDLDLVALATVADLVPLVGENRSLVRRGLVEARRARRPGLRALMAVARVEPSRVDEGDLAFRVGPRINAAGRLYRADAGVELLLTESDGRAAEIASELDRANHERRDAEREVLAGAEAAIAELPDEFAEAPALVLAGRGWHPGVVGIVASRLVERHWRPVVLISIDEGMGKGSGRSIPAFDLLRALRDCERHLGGFGGHRAAAGLRLEASRIDEFRRDFVACARAALEPGDLERTERVDAVVSANLLQHRVAAELERLAPFGMGNPGVRLLVPAAQVSDVRPMGEGKHARFTLHSGSNHTLGVAFGADASLGELDGEPVDALVGLELNQWNGAVEPRVVLRELYPLPNGANGANGTNGPAPGCPGCDRPTDDEWWARVEAERTAALSPWPPRALADAGEGEPRTRIEHPGGAGIAVLAELASSGQRVLGVCADASRRHGLAQRADPARFGPGKASVVCVRCDAAALTAAGTEALRDDGGLLLADWGVLARDPRLARRFEHVTLVDPPPFPHLEALVARGDGYVHVAWGRAELEFALNVHNAEWSMRPQLAGAFAGLREAGGVLRDALLAELLSGAGPYPRTPEQAGRCIRVLAELGLAAWRQDGAERTLRVVSSDHTELERSHAYVAYSARHEEGRRFLSRQSRAR
jgi:single-stranded-DNA-specific exonuclease